MTKSELIEQISARLNLPNGKAEQIVNCIFESMITSLEDGEGIEIRGFGSFTVRQYKAYDGRNPRTGEAVHVAPKRLPFFKVGKDLRERVNPPEGEDQPARSNPDHTPALGTRELDGHGADSPAAYRSPGGSYSDHDEPEDRRADHDLGDGSSASR